MAKWIEDPQGRLEVEKVTEELKLPVWKANYKGKFREFWNECWEKIEDGFFKLKKSNEGKEPVITTKETAFNKPFGVSEDTVLEGNKFTQMTGKDYGGILNIAGQKEAGKAYWDNNTKKLYICKNNNSDISPNVNNYIPFDSNSLLERLENLYKIEYKTDYDVLTILNRKIVIGSLETKGATASKTLIANGFSFKNSIVMATAKKDNCSVAVIHSGDNLDFSTLDATSGNVQNGICKVDFFILLRN